MTEKTHEASPRKKEKARREGMVAKSPELLSASVLMWGLLVMGLGGGMIASGAGAWFKSSLSVVLQAGRQEGMPAVMPLLLPMILPCLGLLGLIFAGSAALSTVLSAAVAGQLQFSPEVLALKPERLNIVNGMQKLVSGRAWVTAGFGLLKMVLAAVVLYLLMRGAIPGLLKSTDGGLEGLLAATGGAFLRSGLVLGGILLAVSVGEAAYARHKTERDLRMTHQEAVEDMRESEGNPLVKRRARSLHRRMARRRMVQAVASSDVVLANPTHVAVALRYKRGRMRAPRVTAKGADLMAQRIKEVAREHGVPVLEQPPLARALYASAQVGKDIPQNLYRAVARILTQVYKAKKGRSHGR